MPFPAIGLNVTSGLMRAPLSRPVAAPATAALPNTSTAATAAACSRYENHARTRPSVAR